MRKYLQKLLQKPVDRLAQKYSSKPDKVHIYKALSELKEKILEEPGKKGEIIRCITGNEKFIIFSDHHKGAKDGADDFAGCEANYLAALRYYDQQQYHLIMLGDCEELWENRLEKVIDNNQETLTLERLFIKRQAYSRVFGNHDLYWDNDPFARLQHERIFGQKIPIYEGIILQMCADDTDIQIFLTHGHQGDKVSDGNAFSKWFIANVWAPFQSYLEIKPNTPAYDNDLKTEHNLIMYGWSALQPNLLLVTGHTHQPVFESLTRLERLYRLLARAKEKKEASEILKIEEDIRMRQVKGEFIPDFTAYQPCYFNSGCCCFNDGDITGLEIENGLIRLIKWKRAGNYSQRFLLEEIKISSCIMQNIN